MRQIAIEAAKWLLFTVVGIVGAVALMVLLGEEAPDAHLSILEFIGLKILAFIVLVACWLGFMYLVNTNLLPKFPHQLIEEE